MRVCVCVCASFSTLPSCVMKIVIARIARETCIGGTYSGFFEPNSHRRTHRNAKHIVRLFFVAERRKKKYEEQAYIHAQTSTTVAIQHTYINTLCLPRNIERAIYHGDIQHFSYGSLWERPFFNQFNGKKKKKLFRALNKIQIKTKTEIEARTVRENEGRKVHKKMEREQELVCLRHTKV